MSKFNSLVERFKTPKKEKISELVERSNVRTLSSFTGGFRVSAVSDTDRSELEALLEKYKHEGHEVSTDLNVLASVTAEIKAISNQAVILHGERIKKIQQVLKNYNEGAFSAWLMQTYGNRQTPYNFMQYYELYQALPTQLQTIIDEMPRQAIYSLSSRNAPQEEKVAFIEEYKGESKAELLEKLRQVFPLAKEDKRNPNKAKTTIDLLRKAVKAMQDRHYTPNDAESFEIKELIKDLQKHL